MVAELNVPEMVMVLLEARWSSCVKTSLVLMTATQEPSAKSPFQLMQLEIKCGFQLSSCCALTGKVEEVEEGVFPSGPERGAHVKLSPGSSHHVNFDGISTAGGKRGRESVEVLVLTDSTSGPPEVVGNQC